ncbi:MAG: putative Ig domain-containing protein [Bryobacterales bacterium]|nr:putative Ig domain-containing protein [Bryobacterales bacterium]
MKHFRSASFWALLWASAAAAAWAQQTPAPTVVSILPNAVTSGSGTINLRVDGTRFTQGSRVVWRPGSIGAVNLATTVLGETLLSAVIPAALLEQPGQFAIGVTQPGDGGAQVFSNEVLFTIFAGVTISSSCPLPTAIRGRVYEASVLPSGGEPPYLWSLPAGALAPGLALSANGVISGTPTTAGEFSFTLRVTDRQNNSAVKPCSLRVVDSSDGQTLFITQLDPSGVLAGAADINLRIRGDGFAANSVAVWNVGTAGATDLATTWAGDPRFLDARIPRTLLQAPGSVPIAVRSVVLTRQVFSNQETFLIASPVEITTPCPLGDGALQTNYSFTLTARGGFAPDTWSLAQGALPAGLTLRPTGELTGAPTAAGAFDLTLAATDSRGNAASRVCSLRVLGPLTTAPASLTFSGTQQGASAPPQYISVSASAAGVTFSAQAAVEASVPWLRVASDTTRMPALVRVTADVAGLSPGTHRGTVTISTDGATNRLASIPVAFVVNSAPSANLEPKPQTVRFAAGRGSGALPWQAVLLTNPSEQAIDVTAESTASWLTLAATRGSVRASQPWLLRLRASGEGLAPGTYRSAIRLTSAGRAPVLVPVSLTVSLAPETLLVPVSGVTFTAVEGGPAPAPRPLAVLSTGSTGYFWEAATTSSAVRAFATVNPPSNVSRPGLPSATEVRVDSAGLAAETHYSDVRFTTGNADNGPRLVSTVLQLLPAQAVPPAELSTGGLLLTSAAGNATSSAQGFTVRNLSRGQVGVDYQLSTAAGSLLSATASAARTIGSGESRRIEVQANTASAGVDVQRASLYVHQSGDAQVRAVDVMVVTLPGGGAACTPTRLLASPLSLADNFQVTGGLPVALEFRVVDDCGNPVNSGACLVAPSTNSGTAALFPLGDGRWGGTWPVLQNTASAVTLHYYLEDGDRALSGAGSLSGQIAASNVPVIAEDAAISAATALRGAPLAPGSLMSIYGAQLAEGSRAAASLPLPTTLGLTRVQVGERTAPLFFAGELGSFTQVNAVLPYEAQANVPQQIAVWRGSRRSPYAEVAVAPAQPTVFVAVDGENPGIIADGRNPVARGKAIVIYCEGLGAVQPAAGTGQLVPAQPLSYVQAPVTVTIGGQAATVLFAGLTPGLTGLYQVNAVIPETVTPGAQVPVVVTAGTLSSEAVAIGVR